MGPPSFPLIFSSVSSDFGFQFIGGADGEHIDGRRLTLVEVGDDLRVEGDGGAEVVGLHVAEDGVAQLACHGSLVEVVAEVDGGHEQASSEDVGLHHHAQFSRDMPGVDGLDDGLVGAGEFR